jgi:acyl-[acyl-carrier-protein] desaturase
MVQTADLSTEELLRELDSTVTFQIDRHLSMAKEWFPHDYVPYEQGRSYTELPWDPSQSTMSEIAQIAWEVNLLTEDNLPSYYRDGSELAPRNSPWEFWMNRWVAEEGRHAIVMRDYLMVTRGVDPIGLERGRMHQIQTAYYHPGEKTVLGLLVYTSFQELATRISHRNVGTYTQDPVAEKLLARVAADENLHMIFYRDLISAAIELTPSQTVKEIRGQLLGFQMPGTGIRDFTEKAKKIARAGIYDLRIHHDEVVLPVLRKWNFFELENLTPEAEEARDQVAEYVKNIEALAVHFEQKRDEYNARQAARAEDGLLSA